MHEFDKIYKDLCKQLLKAPVVGNTRELQNVQFTINDISNTILTIRDISLSYACGELLWYLNGSEELQFINKFGSLWNKMTDDGETVNSAYGNIIMYRHGFNQAEQIVDILQRDPNSRRAVININVPHNRKSETNDEPCTICLVFTIRNNKLNCTAVMRSNDIFFGTPYDVIFFTTMQKLIANALNIKTGTYTHFTTSLHVYDRDIQKVKTIIKNKTYKIATLDVYKLDEYSEWLYDLVKKSIEPKTYILQLFETTGILKVTGANDEN